MLLARRIAPDLELSITFFSNAILGRARQWSPIKSLVMQSSISCCHPRSDARGDRIDFNMTSHLIITDEENQIDGGATTVVMVTLSG